MTRRRSVAVGSVVAAGVLVAPSAFAEPPEREGLTEWSLPGVVRVPFPIASESHLAATGSAGYGYTESLASGDGSHHRLAGDLSLGGAPLPWLQLAGRLAGRYDMHTGGATGSDSSAVGEPSILARAGHGFSDALSAGVDVMLRMPGANAPSFEASAMTPSFRALLGLRASDAVRLGAYAGYRLDRSANSVDSAGRMSLGDRSSLGVSEFDAVLAGLGAAVAAGPGEALGEVTWDLLIGSGAPSAMSSPLRVSAGYRAFLGYNWQLGGLVDVLASGRPGVGPADPLTPVEPRFGVRAVLAYRFGSEPTAQGPAEPERPDEKKAEPAKPEPVKPPPVPVVYEARVVVKSPEGEPVKDAVVMLERGDDRKALVYEDGVYVLEGPREGEAKLVVVADGYEDLERPVTVESGKNLELSVGLDPALPTGQIRGLVRSFSGEPVRATIQVTPVEGGEPKKLDADADGKFTVNVEPGTYQVEIGAEGYQEQRRRVQVKKKGVVILNADLHKGK
jgi:hypothetical protein